MMPLTTEEKIYHNKQKICYICKKEFNNNDKKNYKVRDHCHYMGKFIIKVLVKEFEGNFECLGENTEKYIKFLVPIKKNIENKNLEIAYKIKFIDRYRFMS